MSRVKMQALLNGTIVAKFSKRHAAYTDDHGDSDEQCSKCRHYVDRMTCAIVAGSIRPGGWCRLFEREKK